MMKLISRDPDRGMSRLISEYGGLIRSVIRAKLLPSVFDEADIEDCAADTLAEFWAGRESFDPAKGSIKAFLCITAKRNSLDALRRHYVRAGDTPLDESVKAIPDGADIEAELEDRERRRELIAAIKAMGRPDSEILIRKYYLGQSSKDTAKAMGLSVSNVDTRTHRAIERLRKRFEK